MNNVAKPREIRVFLSSTFRDMEAERNHLIKQVFPKVLAECLSRQVGFTAIDLRWGVTEEASKNGATVEICLNEIDRCRDFPPFFIGFLGERYGWVPDEEGLKAYWGAHEGNPYAESIRQAVKRGISVTELEMELAVLDEDAAEKMQHHALFLLRDRTLTNSLYRLEKGKEPNYQDIDYYDPGERKLCDLKKRIRNAPIQRIDGYSSIDQFGKAVETYLLDQLNANYPASDTPSPFERQQAAHTAFRYQRLQNYLPRTDVTALLIKAINQRVMKPDLGPILLGGPSGQGKSALMADLAQRMANQQPDWFILDHYIGAEQNVDLQSWTNRIIETLHPTIQTLVGDIPKTKQEQRESLAAWITMACREHEQRHKRPPGSTRLLLILDALDQCSPVQSLEVLTSTVLGADAIVVVSAADDTPASEDSGTFDRISVGPLTEAFKLQMIEKTLARFSKNLSPELSALLAQAKGAGSPIFLSLALEKMRTDGQYMVSDQINGICAAADAKGLFLEQFLCDPDYSRPGQPGLAVAFMAFLAAARDGLSEYELLHLLALPSDPCSPETGQPRLPQVVFSKLLIQFAPFILNKSGRRAPMHRLLGEAALEHVGEDSIRKKIAEYFSFEWDRDHGLDRVSVELPYQLFIREERGILGELMSDSRIATRICAASWHVFAQYWKPATGANTNKFALGQVLVKDLIKRQEQDKLDSVEKTRQSIELARGLFEAEEKEWASYLYRRTTDQYKPTGGRVPAHVYKEALRGFIWCFHAEALSAHERRQSSIAESQTLEIMKDQAIDFMAELLAITKNDQCVDRAQDSLLLADLKKYEGWILEIGGTTVNVDQAQLKDIDGALSILHEEDCRDCEAVRSTMAKAYVMRLQKFQEIIALKETPHVKRGQLINEAIRHLEECQAYIYQNVRPTDPQRIFVLECAHLIYSSAARHVSDPELGMNYRRKAVDAAWEAIQATDQSIFLGDQHDFRMLDAAETIVLAIETGFAVDLQIVDRLLKMTDTAVPKDIGTSVGWRNGSIKSFASEVFARLTAAVARLENTRE